MLSFSNF